MVIMLIKSAQVYTGAAAHNYAPSYQFIKASEILISEMGKRYTVSVLALLGGVSPLHKSTQTKKEC